jgi:hypothetical protein
MYDESEFLDASGNLKHEAVRAHFLRVGKLSGLVKGDEIWIGDLGQWVKARCIREISGGCWIVKLHVQMMGMTKTTLTVSNFGGKCACGKIMSGQKLAAMPTHHLDLFP